MLATAVADARPIPQSTATGITASSYKTARLRTGTWASSTAIAMLTSATAPVAAGTPTRRSRRVVISANGTPLPGVGVPGLERGPARRSASAVNRDDEGDDQDRDDVGDFDHRIDRRARRVLVGVTDGVARDRRGVRLGALAAVLAVLDQ